MTPRRPQLWIIFSSLLNSLHYITMDQRKLASRGMVVTPHHLATQSALAILKEGGTAMEATVAAAATIAVVYPNMNSLGTDGFWLIVPPHGEPFVIEACGVAGSMASRDFFEGYQKIPNTGPKSAITVAGTVGGWQEALNYVSELGFKNLSLSRLLKDAIKYADDGFPVSRDQAKTVLDYSKLEDISPHFKKVYMPNGEIPKEGDIFYQKELAYTLKTLVTSGLQSFYRGKLADKIADDMKLLGMPISKNDLTDYKPVRKKPFRLLHSNGEIFNTPPPTQGLASLAILGILDKLQIDGRDIGKFIHTSIEATKQSFNKIRDPYITDPVYMKVNPQDLISDENISELAYSINANKTSKLQSGKGSADTVWIGVMDSKGFSVSFIQSIYQNFGSRVLLPKTGILWHNRGVSFSLQQDHLLSLEPGKKPLHTLSPAAARLNDGRVVVYGASGGDGQPQTQATIFHRYVVQGVSLHTSISAPRWIYGRVFGDYSDKVKIEEGFSKQTIDYLKKRGHNIEIVSPYHMVVGHAGALVRHVNGVMEGASDPRSNGAAAGF